MRERHADHRSGRQPRLQHQEWRQGRPAGDGEEGQVARARARRRVRCLRHRLRLSCRLDQWMLPPLPSPVRSENGRTLHPAGRPHAAVESLPIMAMPVWPVQGPPGDTPARPVRRSSCTLAGMALGIGACAPFAAIPSRCATAGFSGAGEGLCRPRRSTPTSQFQSPLLGGRARHRNRRRRRAGLARAGRPTGCRSSVTMRASCAPASS